MKVSGGSDAQRAYARWFRPLPLVLLEADHPGGPYSDRFYRGMRERHAAWHGRLQSRLAANANPVRRALHDLMRELNLHRRRWRRRPVHARMRLKRRIPRKFYPGKWRSAFTLHPIRGPRRKTRWGV